MVKRLLMLNGLSIVAVVCSHAAQWVYLAMFWWADRYRPVSAPNYDLLGTLPYYGVVTLQKLGVFAVPAFLFASGFFIAYANRGRPNLGWKMVGARLKNLLIPYFIWSIVILMGAAFQGDVYSPFEYLRRFVLGDAIPAYYYVFLLCQLYVLAPLLVPLAKNKPLWLLYGSGLALLGLMGLFYGKFYAKLNEIELPVVDQLIKLIPTRLFIRFIFFFVLGMVASFHLKSFKQGLARFRWLLLAAVLILAPLALLETEWIYRLTAQDWRGGIFTLTGGLYAVSFVLCFLAFDWMPTALSKITYQLGRASFGIYLLHSTVLEFSARSIQKYAPQLLAYPVVFQLSLVLLAVGLPMLIMKAIDKSPMRKAHRYLFG